MIDKLIECGIKESTINKIKEIDFLKYNLEVNLDESINIINYLKEINIKDIDDIFLYVPDLFLKTKEEVEELFNKKDLNKLVDLINENYINIDLLFD